METSSALHEKAARYRRLAAASFDDTRVSEAMSAMADEFEARAAECAAREASPQADHRPADSIEKRSADAAAELCMPAGGGIYRTAIVLVKEYGPTQAPLAAAERAHDVGDLEGQLMWKGVQRAVAELTRTERRSGEPVN